MEVISRIPKKNEEQEPDFFSGIPQFLTLESLIPSEPKITTPATRSPLVVDKPKNIFQVGLKKLVKQLSNTLGPGYRIMCRQCGDAARGAYREYAVVWMPDFQKRLFSLSRGSERTFNELVENDTACRLHLDLDIDMSFPIEATEVLRFSLWRSVMLKIKTSLHELCMRIVLELARFYELSPASLEEVVYVDVLSKMNSITPDTNVSELLGDQVVLNNLLGKRTTISWHVLDASTHKKISKHVIFTICADKYLFKNKRHVGYFVQRVAESWQEEISNDLGTSLSKKSKTEAQPPSTSPSEARGEQMKNDKNWVITTSALQKREVDAQCLSHIDYNVYVGEREFRMYESTKCGEQRPLILESISSIPVNNIYEACIHKDATTIATKLTVLSKHITTSSHCSFAKPQKRIRKMLYWSDDWFQCKAESPDLTTFTPDHHNMTLETEHGEDFYDDDDEEEEEEDIICDDKTTDNHTTSEEMVKSFVTTELSDIQEDWNKTLPVVYKHSNSEPLEQRDYFASGSSIVSFKEVFYSTLLVPFFLFKTAHGKYITVLEKELTMLVYMDKRKEREFNSKSMFSERAKILGKMRMMKDNHEVEHSAHNHRTKMQWDSRASTDIKGTCNLNSLGLSYYDVSRPFFDIDRFEKPSTTGEEVDAEGHPTMTYESLRHHFKQLTISKQSQKSGDDNDDGDAIMDEMLETMKRNGDDIHGKNLISDIARDIEHQTGMDVDGYHLKYKKDYLYEEEMHFIKFATHHKYKKCYLKGMWDPSGNNIHTNENTYFLVRLNDFVFYQKCYSHKCKHYYANTLVHENKLAHLSTDCDQKNSYFAAFQQARGPTRNLSQNLWVRIQNFLLYNKSLLLWQSQEDNDNNDNGSNDTVEGCDVTQ
jgi:hypothetical protein